MNPEPMTPNFCSNTVATRLFLVRLLKASASLPVSRLISPEDSTAKAVSVQTTIVYRVLFVLRVFGGAVMGDNLAWDLADTFNGLMMIPNLIGVIALSGLVMKITNNYVRRTLHGSGEKPMYSAFPDVQAEQEAAREPEGE